MPRLVKNWAVIAIGIWNGIVMLTASATVSPPAAYAQEMEKLSVAEGPGFWGSTPLQFARSKDLFKKHGLDVSVTAIRGARAAVDALANKNVDLAWGASAVITRGLRGRTDTKIIVSALARPSWLMVAAANIRTPKDLEGKRVATSEPGNIDRVLAERVLMAKGVDIDKVTFHVMPIPQRSLALRNGQVDAMSQTPPRNVQALDEGFRNLIDYRDIIPSWVGGNYNAQADILKERPEAIKKFLRSLKEAIQSLKDPNKKNEAVAFLQKNFKVSAKAAELAYGLYINDFGLHLDIAPVKAQWDETVKLLKIANPPPVESIVDYTLVAEVLREP